MKSVNDTARVCEIEGCGGKHLAKGYCNKHYKRNRLYGSPDIVKLRYTQDLTVDERFDSYVEQIPFSECWLWTGDTTPYGYGRVYIDKEKGRVPATHYMYERHFGPVPEGKLVLHTCHNGHLGCVSPDHLKLGTQYDNMQDRMKQGNYEQGEAHYASKLTETQVHLIRLQHSILNVPRKEQALRFNVTEATIKDIRSRKSWKHV